MLLETYAYETIFFFGNLIFDLKPSLLTFSGQSATITKMEYKTS